MLMCTAHSSITASEWGVGVKVSIELLYTQNYTAFSITASECGVGVKVSVELPYTHNNVLCHGLCFGVSTAVVVRRASVCSAPGQWLHADSMDGFVPLKTGVSCGHGQTWPPCLVSLVMQYG